MGKHDDRSRASAPLFRLEAAADRTAIVLEPGHGDPRRRLPLFAHHAERLVVPQLPPSPLPLGGDCFARTGHSAQANRRCTRGLRAAFFSRHWFRLRPARPRQSRVHGGT